jgi:ATP-dependent helicase/nuclease subunit A
MSAPRKIPDSVRDVQIAASNPDVSAWVAANAGSGKTHVLAQRVIRLLLNGVEPSHILSITFTKAAAANMANRVFERLAGWTALDDSALDAAMSEIGVGEIDGTVRARARQLFALALETPGGLKVQTIHAFCAYLLHLFPFVAKVAARFTVLDEATERQLLDALCLKVLLEAAAKPDSARGRALATAIASAADQTFRDLLGEAIGERDRLKAWIEAAGSVEAAIAQLSAALGIEPSDSEEKAEADIFGAALIKPSEWPAYAGAFAAGSKTDQDQSARLASLATLPAAECGEVYLDIFCTRERSARKSIVTKPTQAKHPDMFARLVVEQKRVCALIERQRAIAVRDRTGALVTIAAEIIDRYRTEKERRGLLDYDDLIDKTLSLLTTTRAAWVHYKLDRGIDHVLIDEAQDTSPKQWEIISRLVSEFTAGAGARGFIKRTIFAVGDEKQSIFSFQGAAPLKFAEMRRHFERAYREIQGAFVYSEFKLSFRSGQNVLAAVDAVFRAKDIYPSVTSDQDGPPPHEALEDAAPGLVEIWSAEKPDEKREIEGWDAPFDELTQTSPQVRLARKIAKNIQHWRHAGTRPGEVLILVRRRGALFEAIIRALKDAGIAVAGADRLVLTEHIAVMDLIALADALLLPDDDLALATVLKSPLFGLDEQQLFDLAWDRKGCLRDALRAKKGDPHFAQVAARIDELELSARTMTPFAFYARLLNAENGRKRILARLGHEASDALDEFLNLALDYERGETPSLQGFVAWLRAARASIKRDMEIARDEVRVMTVHGAKGLEARIVILADTTTPPEGWHPPRLLALPAENAAPDTPARLVWAGPENADVGAMGAARVSARELARDEYRRLLYVAMTRAAERLIVCGAEGERGRPRGCWYDLVHDALKNNTVEEPADDGVGIVWRYRKTAETSAAPKKESVKETKTFALPEWLERDAPKDGPRRKIISPSSAYENELDFSDETTALLPGAPPQGGREQNVFAARQNALRRGNLVHRLMQSLPDIAPEHRADAANRYLAREAARAAQTGTLSEAECREIASQVLAMLDDPRFAELFAPGSRAELPIGGHFGDRMVAGQVDRLVVTPDAVLIADYKTNRPAPRSLEDTKKHHPAYVTQLALYRDVLARLYPGRPVRVALVWTEVPHLMEIPADALDAALTQLTLA